MPRPEIQAAREHAPEPAAREDALMLRLDHVVELVQQLLEGQSSAVLRLIELERMTGELLSERQPSSRRRPAAGG